MPDETLTMRQRLIAIRDRHYVYDRGLRWACGGCEVWEHPCDDYADAVAALDLLDAAEWFEVLDSQRAHRLVPDRGDE